MSKSCQRTASLLISFLWACVAIVAHAAVPLAATAAMPVSASSLSPALTNGFTIAVSSAPRTLNPATATDAAGARLLQLTHPALLGWNTHYQPTGLVAENCTQLTLTTATCTLNPAKTFTDGSPITAPALAGWLLQIQSNTLSPFTQLKNVSITAPNPTTLHFTLPSPTLSFLGMLTEIPLASPVTPTIGAGPYHIAAQSPLGDVTLATSQKGLPPQLTFVPIADATTRLLKLKKGEVDAIFNDLPPQLVDWARQQGFIVTAVPGTSYSYLGLNFTNPTLANPQVREALAISLNRSGLRKFLLGDLATPASTLLPPGHPATWNAPEETFDPFTAENLLDDANILRGPDNMRFSLTLLTSTDPFSQRVSQAIQAQWKAIGVDVKLRPTEWASFYDAVKKGNFDAVMLAWTGEQQPSFYFNAFNGSQTPPVGLNRGRVNDPELNRLTTQIMQATTPQAQIAATVAAQQKIADLRPYIPLYRRHQILVTIPSLIGCTIPPSGAYTGLLTCRRK